MICFGFFDFLSLLKKQTWYHPQNGRLLGSNKPKKNTWGNCAIYFLPTQNPDVKAKPSKMNMDTRNDGLENVHSPKLTNEGLVGDTVTLPSTTIAGNGDNPIYTPRKFNIFPENRPSEKETIVFQPSIFQGLS